MGVQIGNGFTVATSTRRRLTSRCGKLHSRVLWLRRSKRGGSSRSIRDPKYGCSDRKRVYRGDIDTPKTNQSVRKAALSGALAAEVETWRKFSVDTRPEVWVFRSATGLPWRHRHAED